MSEEPVPGQPESTGPETGDQPEDQAEVAAETGDQPPDAADEPVAASDEEAASQPSSGDEPVAPETEDVAAPEPPADSPQLVTEPLATDAPPPPAAQEWPQTPPPEQQWAQAPSSSPEQQWAQTPSSSPEQQWAQTPPGYQQPPQQQAPYYGQYPAGVDWSFKDKKIAAGICGILLGSLGIHKFVLGYTQEGVIMLVISLATLGLASPIIGIIGIVEGVIYLTKSDEDFVMTYGYYQKKWF